MPIRQIAALIQCHWRICLSQNARLPNANVSFITIPLNPRRPQELAATRRKRVATSSPTADKFHIDLGF